MKVNNDEDDYVGASDDVNNYVDASDDANDGWWWCPCQTHDNLGISVFEIQILYRFAYKLYNHELRNYNRHN